MIKETVVKTISCDVCNADVGEFAKAHRVTVGFSIPGGESFGVSIVPSMFGEYREHVCQHCFDKAIIAVAKTLTNGVF